MSHFSAEFMRMDIIERNPLAWMIMVDGLVYDARHLPREIQAEAFARGLIPYIPTRASNRQPPALTRRWGGEPFQAGCRLLAPLCLAPEQLVSLGQHQPIGLPNFQTSWLTGSSLTLICSLTCLRRASASGHSIVRSPHSSQPQPPDQGTDQSPTSRTGRPVIAMSRRSQSRASSSGRPARSRPSRPEHGQQACEHVVAVLR